MIRPLTIARRAQPVVAWFAALAPLDGEAITALEDATDRARAIRARRELWAEGDRITGPQLVVSGWGARSRVLDDGRRQILSFLLPGDLIGMGSHAQPLSTSAVIAMTDLGVCTPPAVGSSERLDAAYAISQARQEAYLLAQITRLGRLNAYERIADLLLEFVERLTPIGLATNGSFEFPLTQEMLADALGLTPVHINRTLQSMRRDGDLNWKSRHLTLNDPQALAGKIGRAPVRVSAAAF
jgi:CRP-like cAMP-binding protein